MRDGLDIYTADGRRWLRRVCEVCGHPVAPDTGYAFVAAPEEGSATLEARCKDHLKPTDNVGVWTHAEPT